MIKNFGRDFFSAILCELFFIMSYVMDSLVWMIISGAMFLFFIFSIVIKVIIECETTYKTSIQNNSQKQVKQVPCVGTTKCSCFSESKTSPDNDKNPQDDPGKANVADNGDTDDSIFPADSTSKAARKILKRLRLRN